MLVTAYASSDTAEEALTAGAWQVLSKPVNFPKLMSLVDQALEQPLVMIVDDDRDLCQNLWDLLRERGFRVSLAHDREDAERQLHNASHKIVLIDMKVPGGDGQSIFRLVRKANPQARTVLITGYRQEMDQLVGQILNEGADDVCYKPFDVPTLLDSLKRLALSHKRERAE